MEDITRSIDALTSLIEVNNKRMKIYQALAEKMHHSELRSLFSHYAEQSGQFSKALSTWRSVYGGFDMLRKKSVWEKMTSFWEHWLRKSVASKCEELERDIFRAYRTAIQLSILPAATTAEIERQVGEFEKALIKLRTFQEQPGKSRSVYEELVHTPAF